MVHTTESETRGANEGYATVASHLVEELALYSPRGASIQFSDS